MEVEGTSVHSMAAGRLNSCAVLADGELWTWGCGKSGKLGHGGSDSISTPSRVEALVDRAAIVQAALGDNHSVFLDANGHLWSCGENREGQCGLGSGGDAGSAKQGRELQQQMSLLAFHEHFRMLQSQPLGANLFPSPAASAPHALLQSTPPNAVQSATHHPLHHTMAPNSPATSPLSLPLRTPGPTTLPRPSQWPQQTPSRTHPSLAPPPAFTTESCMLRAGMRPGEAHLPVRVGAPQHPLLGFSMTSWLLQQHQPSLEHEVVTQVSASKAYTAAATADGSVWTLGSMSRAAATQPPSQLQGEVDALLRQHGGAAVLKAGEAFCLALAVDGTAILWGRLPTGTLNRNELAGTPQPLAIAIPNLPPLTHIAAGQHHALLSDGSSIWAVGRWVTAAGREAGSTPAAAPQLLVKDLPSGVSKLQAGMQTSAAVGHDGRLWMWGKLMDANHAEGLYRRAGGVAAAAHDAPDWSWAGFGADKPTVVAGLEGVRDIALGGWHALAMVE